MLGIQNFKQLKRLFYFLGAISIFFISSCDVNSDKLGYVESDRLLSEFKETKVAVKDLEKNTEQMRNRFDTLRTELEQLQNNFTEKLGGLSVAEREQKKGEINRKRAEVDRYYQMMSEKIREKDEEITADLLVKINKVVKNYGEEHGYTFIFGATTTGNIVFADEAKNLTDEIIKELNKD